MESLIYWFSDFLQSDIDHAIYSITNIDSPFYTWFFLWVFIKFYRKLNNI